ncbi:hypothetical protein CSAL01_08924 [Colletotrichum salicis]|uniref:Uncharacterized protein n=1 Tax=Colletotrichum salicis TaxID=1209931 RepID=A0A135SPR3_9PEZI|nr:hypothetical protein CSAL01_08924 [Colletotrichum salicis]
MYGPNQTLPHMTKDGENDPIFIADGLSDFSYEGHLSSSFFWSPPASLGDTVPLPYWQNMTKLKVNCDIVAPSGEWYLQHFVTFGSAYLRNAGVDDVFFTRGDAEEPVWEADADKLTRDRFTERGVMEVTDPRVACSKVMVPMLTSIANAAGQMISLRELRFKIIMPICGTRNRAVEGIHRFHVDYLAPGVKPDFGSYMYDGLEFPRCECRDRDELAAKAAFEAGDREKAEIIRSAIKTRKDN